MFLGQEPAYLPQPIFPVEVNDFLFDTGVVFFFSFHRIYLHTHIEVFPCARSHTAACTLASASKTDTPRLPAGWLAQVELRNWNTPEAVLWLFRLNMIFCSVCRITSEFIHYFWLNILTTSKSFLNYLINEHCEFIHKKFSSLKIVRVESNQVRTRLMERGLYEFSKNRDRFFNQRPTNVIEFRV